MSESLSASNENDAQPGGGPEEVAPADFQDACREAGIPMEDRSALWKLHASSLGRPDEAERLERLLEDYDHWQLYQSSRSGDERAAREFERYWTKQARAFFRARFAAQDADDLTAAFFERVYRLVRDEFAWAMPFSVYLRTILLNLGRDHVGRLVKQREREASLDDGGTLPEALGASTPEPSPEQSALEGERMAAMRRAMWELSPSDRHVVIALVLEDREPETLAEELGISRNALYQRLHRARARLKKRFQEEGLA